MNLKIKNITPKQEFVGSYNSIILKISTEIVFSNKNSKFINFVP